MCGPLAVVAPLVGAALGAGATVYSASKQASAAKKQRRTQAEAETSAATEAQRAELAYNKANQKTPDLAAIMAANKRAANGGVGSTFLTGAGGTGMGLLGSTSLLGQ